MTGSTPLQVKITRAPAYFISFLFVVLLYVIGQAIFFISARRTDARICDAVYTGARGDLQQRIYYACFVTEKGEYVKAIAGSNHIIPIIYRVNNPEKIRQLKFTSLWLLPSMIYFIPLGIVWAGLAGVYYRKKYIIISKKPWRIKLSNE